MTGGPVAARSQRRPGRRPAAQHPGARPVAGRRTRVRGGHTPSVSRRRSRRPATPLRRQRPGPAGPGRPPDGGVRGTYRVPRRLAAGRRSGAADRRGVRDSRRLALAVAADRSRTSGPVQDHGTGPGPTGTGSAADQPRSGRSAQCCGQANHHRDWRIVWRPRQERRAARVGAATQPSGQDSQGTLLARTRCHHGQVRPYGEQPVRPAAGLLASERVDR